MKLFRIIAIAVFLSSAVAFAFLPVFSSQDKTAQEAVVDGAPAQKTAAPQPAEEEKPEPPLPAFGYDIFRTLPEPIVEGPVDDDYLISPGDEIVIRVWGQLNLNYALTVSEDGFIEIPEEGGRVFTNGVSLRELKGVVTEAFSRIYSSYIDAQNPAQSTAFVDVRLAKVRKLLVYVMGEVQNPGAYTISSAVANLLNVLTNAGGVMENGTLRRIRIRRADGSLDTVDLYDFLLTGNLDPRISRLRYGDSVVVPLKEKSVTVKGKIRRPGIYEAIRNEGISDAIRFAGGLAPNAALNRAQVRRFEIGKGEQFIDIDLEPILSGKNGRDFVLQDGDEVTIHPNILVRRRMVEIEGEGITRPGIYQFRPGMTVRDLIEAAEGLKEYVHLARADLIRTAEDFSKKLSIFSLADLYKETAPGTYAFVGTPDKNFRLREMDRIVVYSEFAMRGGDKRLTLEGHVKDPGTFVLAENMSLYDVMFSRGGFTDPDFRRRAFLETAHIFRQVPGEVQLKMVPFNLKKLLEGDPAENIPLQDADRIVVYSYEQLESNPVVEISGLVKRPGTFPLAVNLTLGDLILMAGGLDSEAYKVEALIARRQPAEEDTEDGFEVKMTTLVVPIPMDIAEIRTGATVPLQPYDRVIVRNLDQWEPLPIASVTGRVLSPGSYAMAAQGDPLSRIMSRAGGLKPEAFPEGAYLMRRKNIVRLGLTPVDEWERIAINLPEAMRNPGGPYDLLLKDGDRIVVPANPGTVEVRGAVRKPGILQYRKGKGIGYYIDLCGGWMGDRDNVVVNLPNGSARKVRKFLFFRVNPRVLPGSIIEVPKRTEEPEVRVIDETAPEPEPMDMMPGDDAAEESGSMSVASMPGSGSTKSGGPGGANDERVANTVNPWKVTPDPKATATRSA